MRLAFLGTPAAAVPPLEALVHAGHEVVLVVSQPDRKRGRGGALVSSPVKSAAMALGLSVTSELSDVLDVDVDLGIVVAYGALVPERILTAVPMLNVHFSLLPRWRGAAPVERAILAGDDVTGVCVMGLEVTLDTGPVFARAEIPVVDQHAGELTEQLAHLGADLLVKTLAGALPTPAAQMGEATYAKKLGADDFLLRPSEPAEMLARRVRLDRAVTWIAGRRVRVLRARVSDEVVPQGRLGARDRALVLGAASGSLVVEEIRPEGGRTMSGAAWLAGARLAENAEWGPNEAPHP